MDTDAMRRPGDYQFDPKDFLTGEQPLSGEERMLLKRCYELFEFFRERLQTDHAEMREARAAREMRQEQRSQTSPPIMTFNSCVDNVIADQIDNTPEAVLAPERPETDGTADQMTDLVGYVLHKADWQGVYQKIMEDVAVTGTGIVEVFWDNDAMNGEGMVSVGVWHPEDFYPDPMYQDIQDGRACFKATRTTVGYLADRYPDIAPYIHSDSVRPDDEAGSVVDVPASDGEVTLIEFWYKRYDAKKKRYRVHMALAAGGALLYSTELGFGCDKAEYASGVYAHGQYPFHLFKYRDVFRKPFGTGLYRDFAPTQAAIDRYAKYIDDNARESSVQRHFIRRGSGVNADEIADMSRTVIEWDGSDIREVLQTVQAAPLNSQVFQMMNHLIETMKEDSGQNPFTRGETAGGVTATSAIDRLLTQGSKITRWHAETFKSAFRGIVTQILWILSEYLDPSRKILIIGGWAQSGAMDNQMIEIKPTHLEGDEMPAPAYDVRVEVHRLNPAHTERHDEQLMKAAEIAAQTGYPIPPATLYQAMMGVRDKERIVKLLRDAQGQADELSQLRAQNEQMSAQLEEKQKLMDGWRNKFFGSQGGAAAINAFEQKQRAQGVTPDA